MSKRLQLFRDPRFKLVHNVSQRFTELPLFEEFRLDRRGYTVDPAVIKKNSEIYPGMLVATHPAPDMGNLYSPGRGVVTEISQRYIVIARKDEAEDDPRVPVVDVTRLEGEDLLVGLKNMGIDTRSLAQDTDTLIINGLNPEPGVTWAEPMMLSHVRNLAAGLELYQKICKAKRLILALPEGVTVDFPYGEVVHVDPYYPNSIDELVVKQVMGRERPDNVGAVSLHMLWGLGRIVITGKPLTETVLTLNNKKHTESFIVKDGTEVKDLLQFAKVEVLPGDTVVVGGPLRGQSISLLGRGLDKRTTGLFVVEADTIPALDGSGLCCNCGACVQMCPARINPNMLSRFAEFAMYDRCVKENIGSCLECGLCGYYCITRRPVMQYIRLAKHKLALEKNKLS